MNIYTTYFSNVENLPRDIMPIAICGEAPSRWGGLEYKRLAPKWEFFKVWQENHDNDYYIREFAEKVTGKLNAKNVVMELGRMSGGRDIALVCYEKPGNFCHRHLVAKWLNENGYEVKEWDQQ